LGGLLLLASACSSQPSPTALPTVVPPTPGRVVITMPPRPTESPFLPTDHLLGAADAPVLAVLYGDFQCEVCPALARELLLLQASYPTQLSIVWRHYPMPANNKAILAANAAEAAAAQGKFWPMHDLLLARQTDWQAMAPDQFMAQLLAYAQEIGIADTAAFNAALQNGTYTASIEASVRAAAREGFRGSPVLLFNGQAYTGRIDQFGLSNQVKLILLDLRHYAEQPAMQINLENQYKATLYTAKGEVKIDLFTRDAPVAVNNFIFLARAGWYNDITFHLVTSEIAQTGDPSGVGIGGTGYTIFDERDNGLIFDREGLVAMASQRGIANSASSQFFITFGPLPAEGFNGQYTIFGMVTEGMDVLRQLTPRDAADVVRYPNPLPGDALLRVEIEEVAP
jgi:cyclophilin family peptidyl-prolyl cis-trans isomerase/protein-disulfide isomerase